MSKCVTFLETSGATAVEYALVAAAVSVGILTAMTSIEDCF